MKQIISYQELSKRQKGYLVSDVPETEEEAQKNPPKQICIIDAKKFKPICISDMDNLERVLGLCVTLKRKYKGAF